MRARRGAASGNAGRGSHWIRTAKRHRIYARDAWHCLWCANPVVLQAGEVRAGTFTLGERAATLDHLVPRSAGGDNNAANLLTCCSACNESRGDTEAAAWAAQGAGGYAATVLRILNAVKASLPAEAPKALPPAPF